MFKKEFISLRKKTISILSFMFLVPLFYIFDLLFIGTGMNYMHLIAYEFVVLIFWISLVYTYTFYQQEEEDKAWEYLLTLPVTKSRIFWMKMLPRLVIITILTLIHTVLFILYLSDVNINDVGFFHPVSFYLLLVFMLFLSAFTGWGWNKGKVLRGIFFMWGVFFPIIFASGKIFEYFKITKFMGIEIDFWSIIIALFIIMIVCGIAFQSVFANYDCKSAEIHTRRFTNITLKYFIPIGTISIFLIIIL
ncbi:MAG: ABC-2 transporter permease [Acidobacteria bacterium]|nr:ABC-2 transporter permease [Acidobacteriota bacterium]